MATIGASVGMGTMEHCDGSGRKPDVMYGAVLSYLKSGGRHLDCAECYESTLHVGRAIVDSGVDRAKLHITTKLSGLPISRGDFHGPVDYAAVRQRLITHLQVLGLDRADLLLIHWPGPAASPDAPETESFRGTNTRALLGDPESMRNACSWEYFDRHIEQAWRHMQQLRDEGLCAKIGVSNFHQQHLERLDECSDEPPFANELFIDVTHQEHALLDWMATKGILPIAYRALSFLPVIEMAASMGDGTQAKLAALHEAVDGAESIQQVVLAWLVRRGCHVLAKSADEGRIQQNQRASVLAFSRVSAADWPTAEEALQGAEGSEMVAMCGGSDECAAVFKDMAAPEPAQALEGDVVKIHMTV